MQIHELNSLRRTDEGLGSWAKAVGSAAGTALKQAVAGPEKNEPSASAGILDPKQKLAAVMKEPAMVKLATQYADEWLKDPRSKVPAPTQAVPEAVTTYNKKTGQRTVDGKPQAATLSELPPAVQQQILAKQQELEKQTGRPNPYMTPAAQQPATTTSAKTPMLLKPFQVPGVGTNPNPTTTAPTTTTTSPTATTSAATTVANPAKAKYLKDFLEFANEKIAMRDPSTYKMIGLTSLYTADKKYSLKQQLDLAKQKVISAQGNPAATKEAVKNYILTAMAGAQLLASGNTIAAAQPQTPVLGRQSPAPVKTAAAASNSTVPTTPATGQLAGSNAVALLTKAGLTTQLLGSAGQAIRAVTNNKQLSKTGDSVIDTMLEGMGYTVL